MSQSKKKPACSSNSWRSAMENDTENTNTIMTLWGVFEFIFKIARPCTCEDLLTAQGSEMCSTRFVHCIHERACAQAWIVLYRSTSPSTVPGPRKCTMLIRYEGLKLVKWTVPRQKPRSGTESLLNRSRLVPFRPVLVLARFFCFCFLALHQHWDSWGPVPEWDKVIWPKGGPELH